MKWSELQSSDPRTLALIFDKGDEVVAALNELAREHRLSASHFTGLGAFSDVVLGFFDWKKKDYERIPIREQVEVVSLVGDVALGENGEPKVHAHVVVSTADGAAHGGHLLEAHVRPTLEVVLAETAAHLRRRSDPETGLALIRL